MTLRQDSIKGNLCCNIFSKTSEENLFRVTAPNCQPDLLLSNRITAGTPLLPPLFLHASVSLFLPQTLSDSSTLSHSTLSSPRHPFLSSPSFSHSDTLFRMFTVTSWELIGSQTQDKGTGAMTRDESPLFMQKKCTGQTAKPVSSRLSSLLYTGCGKVSWGFVMWTILEH